MTQSNISFWFIVLVGFGIGANCGMTNLSIEVLKLYMADRLDFKPDAIELSLFTIAVLIGSLISSAGITYLADRFGRKNSTVISAEACCVMNLLCIF